MFTWTIVLKARCSPNPTVLCIIWTCMHSWIPVLKTTRFPYSNRRCCHIRVFHPYLIVPSPTFIILWHGPKAALVMHYRTSMATSAGMTALWWAICYPTGLMSAPFWSIWFIIHFRSLWPWTVISRKDPGSIPRISVQVWFHFIPQSKDIHLRWTGEYFQ